MWEAVEIIFHAILILGMLLGLLLLIIGPLVWTVQRVLRPVDRLVRERNLPFRFSIGDFLCLFWIVQIPLAFVYRMGGGRASDGPDDEALILYYWILTVAVWVIAPLAWFTVARALSKAGISTGLQSMVFLGVVLPTVYYGLFAYLGLTILVAAQFMEIEEGSLLRNKFVVLWWFILGISLFICGFYSPWMVRHVAADANVEPDNIVS